ncbi:hypothetical protein MPTK1_8g09140 [Marchantia polymorpha subsp. ruderalis]|uniref:Uncharacterized protein n=1 Tax=Marchantia polymorpha TaxID=3197 RepID=A0A2R6WRI3_MARPO|nr:hypothetical protein MARPO_0063s0005 [Marchantia polymorpha]BBN19256.1 hypothetical protein Mp_8g09140 [Marchantia polymorpha subsp. ruderalis]|eukprot:PTQ36456.1 hypothetical protein MARPO_0063s0005 [Marchantia polymorpha]
MLRNARTTPVRSRALGFWSRAREAQIRRIQFIRGFNSNLYPEMMTMLRSSVFHSETKFQDQERRRLNRRV